MLVLDIKAQRQIRGLILRAAGQPVPRHAVASQIAQLGRGQSLNLDPSRCVVIEEDYLVTFCFEDAPGMGLARHLAVSRGKREALPGRVAVETLKREFGITTRLAELVCWFQPVPGRGTAVHLLEPLTVLNSVGLPLSPEAQALVDDDSLASASDEELEAEEAA
jgi:hypothetical protein